MTHPNILFLIADDLRFDTIASLPYVCDPAIRTPSFDRLVARGTAFTHAHIPGATSGAVCMPSRAMLHTGRTLFHIQGAGEDVAPEHTLLGEHLQANGYTSFAAGKWHNSPASHARSFSAGAEIFFGGMCDHWNVPANNFDPTGRYPSRARHCMNFFHAKTERVEICDHIHPGRHSSELFADATIDFLRRHDPAGAPFFAYTAFTAPHDPRVMPDEYRKLYRDEDLKLPESFFPEHPFDFGGRTGRDETLAPHPRTEAIVREHTGDYYAIITHLDAQIGRILDTLDERGLTDNTIIVMTADHGIAIGRHGLFGKQNLYDHSIRIPLILAGPGIPAGQHRDQLVYLLDMYPTLCSLAGLDKPDSVEGMDLCPALHDPDHPMREELYLAYIDKIRGVRTRRHKLLEYHVGDERHHQLFDVEHDPHEMANLINDPAMQAIADVLRSRVGRLAEQWGDRQTGWGERFWGAQC